LNFGKNASVVKLKPTKAIVAATEAERKLRQELEEYKVSCCATAGDSRFANNLGHVPQMRCIVL